MDEKLQRLESVSRHRQTDCLVLLSLYTPADGEEPRLGGIGACAGLLTTSRAAGICGELPGTGESSHVQAEPWLTLCDQLYPCPVQQGSDQPHGDLGSAGCSFSSAIRSGNSRVLTSTGFVFIYYR